MSYTIIFYLIMLLVFISYVTFIWVKYGIQSSISESFYILPHNEQFLFTVFCWGFAAPAMIAAQTALMFFAGAGICFVGAAGEFKESISKQVHMVGAFGGVALSQLSIFFNFHLWPINIAFILISSLILIFRKTIKHQIWWVEIIAFLSICLALGIKLFFV